MRALVRLVLVASLSLVCISVPAATADEGPEAKALSALQFRGIGPAMMGGRIADIAIDPEDRSTWYLAVGSGGVWKSSNSGITWRPIFDSQPSYSIGCLAIDPTNTSVLWAGTGENVSGRHVGWGDGVYKSLDGGETWEQMGLERSEHVSEIIVDPRDGDVVYVAAEGPLWTSGGERGLYKTVDGGATWELVLSVNADTGVTSLELDPRDADVLYAATYERRRKVWAHLAGGPGSGIHKSVDGGATWRRLARGLPKGDMGKIGLAVSPADPDVVYATIEADQDERGFYRSLDRGASWQKRNSYISNGTGPHYYQEIYASPHDVDHVYQMDVFMHFTEDGGASFRIVGNGREKHSDNHALAIDPADPEHLIVGTDASLYETFDHGESWRQTRTLPISQFYKLALDNAEPFYNILGGAQDLGTLIGPSRTRSVEGIRNQDWWVPLGADGYSSAFDTEIPELLYIEWQGGRLNRYDLTTDEALDIQPQPEPGDAPERFNWDAPVRTSPHSPTRLYFASQRLWRSEDRGNSWTAISGDLTRGGNRYELAINGRVRSVNALYDNGAMSLYATLTSIAESPLDESLIYTGSDDGLVQVTENGGADWRLATAFPGVPERSFINDLKVSLHDPDTVYAVVDAHKTGDYSPYLFVSSDRGRNWRSLAGDLPATTILWAFDQDHVEPRLLFVGSESGIHASLDGGSHWLALDGGTPTISFRDLEIQRRDNDLVGATFGRGFYVLDDYSPLREIAASGLGESALFPVRDAWWYVERIPMQAAGKPSQGSTDFDAPNPPYGALFTYYLTSSAESPEEQRRERERALAEAGKDVPFPGWETLREESLAHDVQVVALVRDEAGQPVRRLTGPAEAGLHRLSWDLRRQAPDPIDFDPPAFRPPWAGERQGPFAGPGRYTVEIALLDNGALEPVGVAQTFTVKAVPGAALPDSGFAQVAAFQQETAEFLRQVESAGQELRRAEDALDKMQTTAVETPGAGPDLLAGLSELSATLRDLRLRLLGDRVRGRMDEASLPSIARRVGQVAGGHWGTRLKPTATQRRSLEIARGQFTAVEQELQHVIATTLPELRASLEQAGGPWTP